MVTHSSRMPRIAVAGLVLVLAFAATPAASAGMASKMWGQGAARATTPAASVKNLRL